MELKVKSEKSLKTEEFFIENERWLKLQKRNLGAVAQTLMSADIQWKILTTTYQSDDDFSLGIFVFFSIQQN